MVAAPAVIWVAYVGGSIYTVVIGVAAVGAAWEAFDMLRRRGYRPALVIGLCAAGLLAVAPGLSHGPQWFRGVLLVEAMVAGCWYLVRSREFDALIDWVLTVGIALYCGGLLGSLTALRSLHDGFQLVALVLVVTWSYDTGAYLLGRFAGRRPFMQWISPSKTWEGVAGGVGLSCVAALALAIPFNVAIPTALVLGVVVAVAAQAGDLLESLLKRHCGVKDSGVVVPGHGGLLDRIDSLLFTSSAAFFVLLAFGYR